GGGETKDLATFRAAPVSGQGRRELSACPHGLDITNADIDLRGGRQCAPGWRYTPGSGRLRNRGWFVRTSGELPARGSRRARRFAQHDELVATLRELVTPEEP